MIRGGRSASSLGHELIACAKRVWGRLVGMADIKRRRQNLKGEAALAAVTHRSVEMAFSFALSRRVTLNFSSTHFDPVVETITVVERG